MSYLRKVVKASWKVVRDAKCHAKHVCCTVKARLLKLECGHKVVRHVAWNGARDPHDLPPPKRVLCKECAAAQDSPGVVRNALPGVR